MGPRLATEERMSITAQDIDGPAGRLHVDDGGTGGDKFLPLIR